MAISKTTLDELAISEAEYEIIVERLGREPNHLEVGIFGSLWSEHCAYKHSKPLLTMFETSNTSRMIVTHGQENAGAVDIGDGLAVVMKIESHNHPSAIEPYQGAATGVGGIVRDILAMGARPIALLNSLRFGPLDIPRNRYLFEGVISGISGYGNCLGIPDIGGEINFSHTYSGNPLVNAMCVGIAKSDQLLSATTGEPGNLLVLVGASTGRDGIHGASGLASRTFENERELRPAVQVGNPFMEKKLIEACLEAADAGYVTGLQDLGAAGLSTASVEIANKGDTGIQIDVSQIPRRDQNMTPYEVMLSESQERMLVTVKTEHLDKIKEVFGKWGLESAVIGQATEGNSMHVLDGETIKGEIPVKLLSDAPTYKLDGKEPERLVKLKDFDLATIPVPKDKPGEILIRLLSSPNIGSKRSVYQQYDHQVQTNTVMSPGDGDAAILRIPGTSRGIALSTDGNGKYCYLDPYIGGMIAVSEACRNIASVGGEPIALTDCLNFGNPERSDTYFELEKCIEGISLASEAFAAPVVSGNVSLYNETHGKSIYPTPVIGGLGLLEDVTKYVTQAYKNEGDIVILIGPHVMSGDPASLAGSEYLNIEHGLVAGELTLDINMEIAVQRTCRRAIGKGIIRSAHDCSDGGLLVTIAESCISGRIGFEAEFEIPERWDAALFGEDQSRIIVSLNQKDYDPFLRICEEENVPHLVLGYNRGSSLVLGTSINLELESLKTAWDSCLA